MPPFKAVESDECPNPWGFTHDPRLSPEDTQTIEHWVAGGAPGGDPLDAAPLIDPPSTDLDGANQEIHPPGAHTTALAGAKQDEFVCFSLDPALAEDGWLEGLQVLPDRKEVVHHVLVGIDHLGQTAETADAQGLYPCFGGFGITDVTFVGGWVPGASPIEFPAHTAIKVQAGARILLQMHYHLIEEAIDDGTGIALKWGEDAPVRKASIDLIGNAPEKNEAGYGLQDGPNDPDGTPTFFIPKNVSDHTETMKYPIFSASTRAQEVFLVGNHMHYVGQDMRLWFEDSNSASSCLLHTPEWDFNWQLLYHYDVDNHNAPLIQPGSTLWMQCQFNNTLANPGVVQVLAESGLTEPVDVGLGSGSLDEMCLALFGTVPTVQFDVDNETHKGTMTSEITIDGSAPFSCDGPASFRVDPDRSMHGVAACGIPVDDTIITVEIPLEGTRDTNTASGTAEIRIVDVADGEESFTVAWTGTFQDSALEVVFEDELLVMEMTLQWATTLQLAPQY